MARTKFFANMLDLRNTEINSAPIAIDTAQLGVGIGNTPASGQILLNALNDINIDADAGITIDNNTSGNITISQNNSTGDIDITTINSGNFNYEHLSGGTWGFGLNSKTLSSNNINFWSTTWSMFFNTTGGLYLEASGIVKLGYYSSGAGLLSPIEINAYDSVTPDGEHIAIDSGDGFSVSNYLSGDINITNNVGSGEINLVDGVGQQIKLNDQTDGNRMVLEADGPGLRIDLASGAGMIVDSFGGGINYNIDNSGGFRIKDNGNPCGGIAFNLTGSGAAISLSSTRSDTNTAILLQENGSGVIKINASGTGSKIDIDSDAGITINNNTSGDIDIKNNAGDIEIDTQTGMRLVNRTSGYIELVSEGSGGVIGLMLENKVSSGRIEIKSNASSNGGINIANSNGGAITIQNSATASGGISLINSNNGSIDIVNSAGNITLTPHTGNPVKLEKSQKRTVKVITNVDSPYTAGDEMYIIADTSGGAITINLPSVSNNIGLIYKFKNIGSNNLTVQPNGTEKIDNQNSLTGGQDSSAELVATNETNYEWCSI